MPEFDSLSFEEKRAFRVFANMYSQRITLVDGEFNRKDFTKRMDRNEEVCKMLCKKIMPFIAHLVYEA